MLKSIEGILRNGKVELLESVPEEEGAHVLVTFLPRTGPIDLRDREIGEAQAADLRGRLRPFADDWDRSDMDVYDEM